MLQKDFQKPRPHTDASLRMHHYGPLHPAEDESGAPVFGMASGLIPAVLVWALIGWGVWSWV